MFAPSCGRSALPPHYRTSWVISCFPHHLLIKAAAPDLFHTASLESPRFLFCSLKWQILTRRWQVSMRCQPSYLLFRFMTNNQCFAALSDGWPRCVQAAGFAHSSTRKWWVSAFSIHTFIDMVLYVENTQGDQLIELQLNLVDPPKFHLVWCVSLIITCSQTYSTIQWCRKMWFK